MNDVIIAEDDAGYYSVTNLQLQTVRILSK